MERFNELPEHTFPLNGEAGKAKFECENSIKE